MGIPAAQQRLVLAVLLAEAGQIVTTDRLVDELWGDEPPRTATSTVQVYVMRLRRMLDGSPVALVTRGHGYQLLAGDGAVDGTLFEEGAEAGRRSLAAGRTGDGVGELTEALGLWRGRAFADVPPSQTVTAAVERLEQLRVAVTEDRLSGALDLGRHADVIAELEQLVQVHPFRERLYGLHMTALYRCGRRAEAVAAYQRARSTLVTELGLEPSPELRRLHQAILTDSSELAPPPQTAPLSLRAPRAGPLVAHARFPEGVTGFVGRDAELALLDSAVDRDTTVVALDGMAGVGKTALALHWSHRARDRFPDGRLYVHLGGHGGEPVDAGRLAARYRERLAGRRALVLLDNVHDAEQIRPLLVGIPGCVVLVTSRAPLDGLPEQISTTRVPLDVLSPAEAGRMLEHLVGALRVSAEPEAAARLAHACAYLPLALRAAALGVVGDSRRSIADYVNDLAVATAL